MSLRIPETTPTLQLQRVVLRPFCDADIEGRQRLGRDPEIQRGFGANPSYDEWQPMDHAAATSWYEQQLDYDGPFVWAIELDGRLIGTCRLRSSGIDRTDERARYSIGILDRELLDRGIGTEATNGVLDYAFDTVGFHRIDLRVLASNQRAIACYRKCGFVIEGRERESAKIGDRREDDLFMAVLAPNHARPARSSPGRGGPGPRAGVHPAAEIGARPLHTPDLPGLAEPPAHDRGGAMKYFVDTEHTDDGERFELISIAVVCEDGREYYAAVEGYDDTAVTPWIQQNVLSKLPPAGDPLWRSREQIRGELIEFVVGDDIEFWTMCAWADWSLVVRLFGRFEDVPSSWPMACWDLWQLEAELGVTQAERPPGPDGAHNALVDARYHRQLYESLRRLQHARRG